MEKLISLFPIQSKIQVLVEIKKSLNTIMADLPKNVFDEVKDEVREICADYKWAQSKEGTKIIQIERWIEEIRFSLANDFPNELIYIGRSFANPISIIVGGYVKDYRIKDTLKTYLGNKLLPTNIDYKIHVRP